MSEGFNTRAIHAGQTPDPTTGAVIPALYQSTTYAQDGIGKLRNGYEYGRGTNPTRDALQKQLAALEGGAHAYSFSSGLAAEDALIRALLAPGDHIVLGNDAYGGTYRLINRVLAGWGITNAAVDMSDIGALTAAIAAGNTKMVWLETPSNPMMKISDIAAVAQAAHDAGAWLVVDNTFASPYLQRPLELGADVVVHSATKYLNGHGDVIAGFVVGSAEFCTQVRMFGLKDMTGAVMDPFTSFLILRGLKTLEIRMQKHCANAHAVAEFLYNHPAVDKVYFPGLVDHPGHDIARRQMSDFGGMISFEVKGGRAAGVKLVNALHLVTVAVSLGDAETLIEHPASMTHSTYTEDELAASGIAAGLIRLSVGLENSEDIIADLKQALDQL